MTLGPGARAASIERTLIRQIFDSASADAINLGLGQPDLETPPTIALAGVEGIVSGRTGYTTTAGLAELRAAIAGEYPALGAGPDDVVVHVGTQEALFATFLTLLDPGDEVLYPDPGYPAYEVVARLAGARPVAYPLLPDDGFVMDVGAIEALLGSRTRAVVLCSPGNPTGVVQPRERVEALTRLLGDRGVAWISDEIYSGFSYEGPVPSPTEISRQGVVISGLSKTLSMTGWRIGWAVAPAEVARRLTAVHQYLVTCAPSVSQVAALRAFTAEGRREAERYRAIFARRRSRMAQALARVPGIEVPLPGGAFYFFIDVRRFGQSLEIARQILERENVVVIPGEAFGAHGRGFLRLSYAASLDDIDRGVAAIARVLEARDAD